MDAKKSVQQCITISFFMKGVIECNPWDVIDDTTKRNTKNFELLAGKPSAGWGEEP